MRLKTGRTSSALRRLRTSASVSLRQLGQPRVGEAHRLQLPEAARPSPAARAPHALLQVDDLLDALEEPGVDLAGGVDLLVVDAEPQRLRDLEQPVGRGLAERGADHVLVVALAEALAAPCRRGR